MLHIEAIQPGTLSLLISYESETLVSFKNQTWEGIKKGISKIVSDYLR
jgi:hypothetical protein